MKITGNEPANPTELEIEIMSNELLTRMDGTTHYEIIPVKRKVSYTGLTIRQRFAMAAMQGLISNAPNNNLGNSKEGVQLAVQWADDLINELNKNE